MTDPIKELVEYVKKDNLVAEEIYLSLFHKLQSQSLTKQNSILACFFFDLLKYLTGTFFRSREIQHKITPSLFQESLTLWPYTGYNELQHGLKDIDSLSFKKPISFSRITYTKKVIHIFSKITSRLPIFGKKKSIGFLNSSLDKAISLKALLRGYQVEWANPGWLDLNFPNLEVQLQEIKEVIKQIGTEYHFPVDLNLFAEIYIKRIYSVLNLTTTGRESFPDYIISCSGAELKMRLAIRNKKSHKSTVIAVLHGDTFGLRDDPCFGIGECLFSDAMLGYGPSFLKNRHIFKYAEAFDSGYICGDSEVVSPFFDNGKILKSKLRNKEIYYVPTSLRGNRHRWGPYQDLPDHYYLKIEQLLIKHFGKQLKVKTHPKDHYRDCYGLYHNQCVTSPLHEVINKPDIFIFDYASSAFSLACATNKPIIYLDFSIQNIPPHVIEIIKQRCVYVKVDQESDLDFQEIEKRLSQEEKNHTYTKELSLSKNRKSRVSAFFDYIESSASYHNTGAS